MKQPTLLTAPRLVCHPQGHGARVFHVHWSPLLHGVLASGSDDQSVRVWDVCGTVATLCGTSPAQQQLATSSSTSSNSGSKRSSVSGGSSGTAGSDKHSASSGMCCAVLEGHRHNVSELL